MWQIISSFNIPCRPTSLTNDTWTRQWERYCSFCLFSFTVLYAFVIHNWKICIVLYCIFEEIFTSGSDMSCRCDGRQRSDDTAHHAAAAAAAELVMLVMTTTAEWLHWSCPIAHQYCRSSTLHSPLAAALTAPYTTQNALQNENTLREHKPPPNTAWHN